MNVIVNTSTYWLALTVLLVVMLVMSAILLLWPGAGMVVTRQPQNINR